MNFTCFDKELNSSKMKYERKTCEEEYKRDPKLKKEDIQQLKEWVEKQPHMPAVEEYAILQYYHCSDYSQQKTKDLLDLHYSFRNEAPEFFSSPDYVPPRYPYDVWDVCYVIELPNPSPEGYRLIYCGLRDTNPSKYHFEIALHNFIKTMLTVVAHQGHCPGYAFIFDIEGIVISHLATVTISLVRKFLYFVQEAIPVKVKAVHIINVSSIIDKIMMLTKPFLKRELFEMIHIQSDMKVFYKTVPKDCLPSDVGGTLPPRSVLQVVTRAKVDALDDEISQEMERRTNEKKRAGSKRNGISMEGSFKKLSID